MAIALASLLEERRVKPPSPPKKTKIVHSKSSIFPCGAEICYIKAHCSAEQTSSNLAKYTRRHFTQTGGGTQNKGKIGERGRGREQSPRYRKQNRRLLFRAMNERNPFSGC